MRFWNILFSIALIVGAGLGLLVMAGQARDLMAPDLRANLVVQDFRLPQGFGMDPARVAQYMSDQLKQRLTDDVAIRLTLKSDVMRKVKDIVLPRIMNEVAVQGMMHDIPELSAILDITAFHRTLSGTITSAAAAQDVALTAPGALLAEVDGTKVKVAKTSTGLQALELGAMKAGQQLQVTLWLDDTAAIGMMGKMVKLGAADGQRGQVLIWGDQGWFGADVEALRWSRGLIGGLLAGVLLFGLASLLVPLLRHRPR